jgi:peptidyl-prolyl cis-trans isomerase SurA
MLDSPDLDRHAVRSWSALFVAVLVATAALLVSVPAAHAQGSPSAQSSPTTDGRVVDRIAAVVGDDIVLQSDVDQLVSQMVQQRNASYSDQMWMQALNQLIDQKILAEKARRDTTITVSDTQLQSQLNARIKQLTKQAGGKEALEKAYGKSIIELKETFKQDFRDQLLAEQLRRKRMQNIEITPSEVKQWFERIPQDSLPRLPKTVRLAHVVRYPKPNQSAKQQAKDMISTLRDSIVNKGASFEAMAKQFSDDSGTASDGGRLSDVSLDELVPEFAAIASRTPVGKVSQVFYNDQHNGYHILRVNSREGGKVDLNHILIRVDQSGNDASAAKQYLSAVRDTLTKYEEVTFALMAKRHSEETESAQNGGRVTDPRSGSRDLVLRALGPSWKRTINSLEIGDISKPTKVQLLNGEEAFHIVKLQDRTPAHRVNLEQDYDRIRQYALQDKRQRKMNNWLDELREEIYVDIRITEDDLTAMR